MANGRALRFSSAKHVRLGYVKSDFELIFIVRRLVRGPRARTESPILISINKNRTYPIRETFDTLPEVLYLIGPKLKINFIDKLELQ